VSKPARARKPRIILASQSPARRKLMEELGLKFECRPSGYEENMKLYREPPKLARHLALGKALFIAPKCPDSIIIGADTFITIKSRDAESAAAARAAAHKTQSRKLATSYEIIGKPATISEARQIIRKMSGKTIGVHSGIALVQTDAQGRVAKKLVAHVLTSLKIKKMEPHEINLLANQEEALQISGAFSIEGEGGKMVEKIDGDYNNVIGLPLFKLRKMLATFGVKVG
jgi:septum formation protein